MTARPTARFERPAVFVVNGLGDQLIALPAMRALGAIFPGGIQLLLGEGMFSFFYRGLPVGEGVRVRWFDYDKRIIDVERTVAGTAPCDVFVCLSTWAAPSVVELAHRMWANWSVGFFGVFDEVVPVNESGHMFDRLFAIPQHFRPDLRLDDFSYPPSLSTAAEEAAKRFVGKCFVPGDRLLFIHPETLPDKMWSPASFSWVVAHFLEAHPEFKVFVSSVKPYPLDLDRHRHHVVWADDHLELALAMLRHADLFLGIDSCFLHAADLFRVPGVGLFGPTDPHQWGFRLSPRTQSIWGKGSMEGIRRGLVLDALLEIANDCGSESEDAGVEVIRAHENPTPICQDTRR
jgi:hypothetical protein